MEISMADKLRNSMFCIPEDPAGSTYRFIIVAAKRARQLQNGQRSLLPATNKKPTTLAMEEARRGMIPFTDLTQQEPEEAPVE
jgi:DNA-directed RNA polymerase subunit omega